MFSKRLALAVFILILALFSDLEVYAQTDEINPHLMGLKDCSISAAQVRLGEPIPSDSALEAWVGVKFGNGVNVLPELNPFGYKYVSRIQLWANTAVKGWIPEGHDALFYNPKGLVGYSTGGDSYILSSHRCFLGDDYLWTPLDEFKFLNRVDIQTMNLTSKTYFFEGKKLSNVEVLALANLPEGYFGGVVDSEGIVPGMVDDVDFILDTMHISSTGELYYSSQPDGIQVSLGITLPLNSEVVAYTEFSEYSGTCPPPYVRTLVALDTSDSFEIFTLWRDPEDYYQLVYR